MSLPHQHRCDHDRRLVSVLVSLGGVVLNECPEKNHRNNKTPEGAADCASSVWGWAVCSASLPRCGEGARALLPAGRQCLGTADALLCVQWHGGHTPVGSPRSAGPDTAPKAAQIPSAAGVTPPGDSSERQHRAGSAIRYGRHHGLDRTGSWDPRLQAAEHTEAGTWGTFLALRIINHQKRSSRPVVNSPLLEIFKPSLDIFLGTLLKANAGQPRALYLAPTPVLGSTAGFTVAYL